jgi:hypothetical protein
MKTVEEIAELSGRSVYTVRHWAWNNGMERVNGRYYFDEAQKSAFLGRRTVEGGAPQSAGAVAKRAGCSREKVRQWAIKNKVRRIGHSYFFELAQEKAFLAWSAAQKVGPKPKEKEPKPPARPRGRPRKEGPKPEKGPRGRPKKLI